MSNPKFISNVPNLINQNLQNFCKGWIRTPLKILKLEKKNFMIFDALLDKSALNTFFDMNAILYRVNLNLRLFYLFFDSKTAYMRTTGH